MDCPEIAVGQARGEVQMHSGRQVAIIRCLADNCTIFVKILNNLMAML